MTIRHCVGVRGVCEGALVVYDKHMNLVLREVTEWYTPFRTVANGGITVHKKARRRRERRAAEKNRIKGLEQDPKEGGEKRGDNESTGKQGDRREQGGSVEEVREPEAGGVKERGGVEGEEREQGGGVEREKGEQGGGVEARERHSGSKEKGEFMRSNSLPIPIANLAKVIQGL